MLSTWVNNWAGGGVSLSTLAQVLAAMDAEHTNGAYYDPSDTTSLFQNSTGTTPVTADGNPVGLMLDKAQMGDQTAAEFIAGAAELSEAINTTNWADLSGGDITVSDGLLTAVGAIGSGDYVRSVNPAITSGTYYHVTITVDSATGAAGIFARLAFSSFVFFTGSNVSGAGVYSAIIRANDSSGNVDINPRQDCVISNVSIKAIPGYHAVQATTANKPLYKTSGGLHWLDCDGVDDWMPSSPLLDLGTAWTHVGGWRSDTNFLRVLATTSSDENAVTDNGATWTMRNSSSVQTALATGDPGVANVLSIVRGTTVQGRYNGSAGTPFTPAVETGTPGVALASRQNTSFSTGFAGRFYGGLFTAQEFDSAGLALAETLIDQNVGAL